MSSVIRIALVVVLFAALGVAATWPVWSAPFNTSIVGQGENDAQFLVWATFWGYHALTSDPAGLHSANIFHPEPYTYLYSEMPIANSLLTAPWIAIFYHPEFTLSVLILSVIILGGLGMFLLAKDLAGHPGAALFAAVVYMFNPAHFGRLMQLHLFGDHWTPWFIWALLRWLRGNEREGIRFSWQWAGLATLFYVLTVLSGAHIAIFATLTGVVIGLFYLFREKLYRYRRFWFGFAAMVIVALLVLVPIFYPYLFIQEKLRTHRIDELDAHQLGSAGAYELLSAKTRFYNWLDATSGWPGDLFRQQLRGYLFIGAIPLVVAFLGFLRRSSANKEPSADANMPVAWGLDVGLIAVAWMAAVSAIFGNASFLLFFLRFPTPPSYVLLVAALVFAALRVIVFPRVEHVALAAGRWLRRSVRISSDQWPWLILVTTGFLLALGSTGFVYVLFGKLPLISLIRVPSRFILVAAFAVSVLCAFGMARILPKEKGWVRLTSIGVICALFALEAMPEPVKTYPVEEPHPIYHWLAEQEGDFAVMEFPTAPRAYASFIRQVYGSIHHWKRLIVGYSGFQSQENRQLIYDLNETFPGNSCIKMLDSLNVRYVIVIPDMLDAEKKQRLADQELLQFEQSLEGVDIYRLKRGRTE